MPPADRAGADRARANRAADHVTAGHAAAAFARLYDLDLLDDPGDGDLYLALAGRTGGPVLELGVGTGRLAVLLAAAGHRVTGVDRDAAALARARRRAEAAGSAIARRLRLVEADVTAFRLSDAGRFRLAYVPLNTIMLLGSREAQEAAFGALAVHLAPGGIAVVDVWLPDADDLSRFDGRVVLEYARVDPETGWLVTKTAAARHDVTTGTVDLTTIYDEGMSGESPSRWVRSDRLRLVSADELRRFAADAGLKVEVLAGGYGLEPLGEGSERAILVAVRP